MISIIILSYRNPALLRLCLKSLARAVPDPSSVEIVVVDNDTIRETRQVVTEEFTQTFPNLVLVPLKYNAGYTRGVNEGLRAASGHYLLSINYDIVMEPGAIETLAAYLQDHPEVGLIGPRLLNFNESRQDSYFRFYRPFSILSRRVTFLPGAKTERDRFSMRQSNASSIQPVDWVSGAAFMTTRIALDRVGYMDERLFHYFSDVDWAWRFWENGYAVMYYPMAAMYHYHGRTSKSHFGILDPIFNRATRWHIRDAIRYFIKHGASGQRPEYYA
jgi:GT2 family glycosyltransferase